MGRRTQPAAHVPAALARACREVVRDAADIAGSPLVELLVARGVPGLPPWESVAFCAPGASRTARAELARELLRSPAAAELPDAGGGASHRIAACEPRLARLLGARALHEVFLPVGTTRAGLGWLRVLRAGRPDRAALRTYRALARQASGRLEAEALRAALLLRSRDAARDVTREQRARADVAQAKEMLAALNLAGTHLMVETDPAVILGVIARELVGLGFHSAVLVAEPSSEGPRPPYRFAHTSFAPALQRATERVIGRALADVRIDPGTAPLVARVLREGRTTYSARAPEAARQLFSASEQQVKRLARLMGLRHVVIAPLRSGPRIDGLLVVAAARLRRSDPEGIDAFALQASIALEKARLFGALRSHEAQLESEVQRRTVELRRAVAALEDLDRRKDNFLANVSHELRTPLVTVLGYTDLLLSEKLGELSQRQRDCLRVASSSGRRLRSFIDELLEFSRYELTRDRLAVETFDVREVVHQAVMSMAPRFQERGLLLRARVARGTPAVQGDRGRVLQVLVNLLSNAERHCEPGGHVRIAAAHGAVGRVELSVSDDGLGIPPEHLDRIFDRLYQVGDVVKQREKGAGLGLGLAIVKSIVEAHGGSIAVRSQVGHGAVFSFSLPAAPPDTAQRAAAASAPRGTGTAATL
ncbi:MAG TPA: HAMP domain-containing sensor histidine kinase [Anaeromyxobacteraceae bacterium]|nr:HAMP domain-containing sensor histidine kinase [Anaeromyxobacteraceae bacterium]